jgi:glycogen operon protein
MLGADRCGVSHRTSIGRPTPLGATFDGHGVNFAVRSADAESIDVCLVSPEDPRSERRIELSARTDDVHHGYVAGIGPGTLYALRARGRYAPREGLRFNYAKRLVDPYARALAGEVRWRREQLGYRMTASHDVDAPDATDSARAVPPAIVVDPAFDWGDDAPPGVPLSETLIYECHVKGLTALHPGVPPSLRGTYLGLASHPVLAHLRALGVTAIELLPVQQKCDEAHLVERGLTNYWGYNPIAWAAPDPRFATASDGAQVDELKTAIRRIHAAGIEVILDVVFNHSCEGDHRGPTVSLRGLDNVSYYSLEPGHLDRYRDFTGCGNTLRMEHPAVRDLIRDSLRTWVREYHVDGFRFDLAAALAREDGHLQPDGGVLATMRDDPVLGRVKLIAEPWDAAGGSLLGRLPPGWCEWNGEYRDSVRRFWRGDRGELGRFASALAGSSPIYAPSGRGPDASINFVTCHDGPTLADLTSYEHKHNEANGENNRDGPAESFACNWGVEGVTHDERIASERRRARRNLMATVALSLGVPMLQHGDELGRTQGGLDNGYCQDSPMTWVDWTADRDATDMLRFVRSVFAVRRTLAIVRRTSHFTGRAGPAAVRDLVWLHPNGREMTMEDWHDADARAVAAHYDATSSGGGRLLLLLNGGDAPVRFALATEERAGDTWRVLLDTFDAAQEVPPGKRVVVAPRSLILLEPVKEDHPV